MKRYLFAALFVALAVVAGAQTPGLVDNTTTNWTTTVSPVRLSDVVTSETTLSSAVTSNTLTLTAATPNWNEGRQATAQAIELYNNTSNAVVEWKLGGGAFTTLTGASPVTERIANVSYGANVVNAATVRADQVVEIYDSVTKAVILKGKVTARNVVATPNTLILAWIEGANPTSATSGDIVGGPDSYTFTAGTGHLIFPYGTTTIQPNPPYSVLLYRADTGSPKFRAVRRN